MHRLQDVVAFPVDGAAFLLGIGSPQHEDQPMQVLVEPGHHDVRELLPASLLVGGGLVSPHREHSVEQQHSLLGPASQITMTRMSEVLDIRR